jgi:predicted  nucleic acid-binding Zn-ribbon protein
LKKESRNIQTEFRTRKQDIEILYSRLETLRIKLEKHKDTRFMRSTEIDEMQKILREKESALEDVDRVISEARTEIEKLEKELSDKVAKFEEWKFNVKNQMADIEARQNIITGGDIENSKQDNTYTNW